MAYPPPPAVLNSQVLVLKGALQVMKTEYDAIFDIDDTDANSIQDQEDLENDNLQFVFHFNLTFYDSVNERKVYRLRRDIIADKDIPLIAWNKDPMAYAEELQARSLRNYTVDKDGDSARCIAALQTKMHLNMLFLANRMQDLDAFELFYLMKLMPTKLFKVDFGPDLGVHEYVIDFGDLESFDLDISDVFYHGLTFGVDIRGSYFLYQGDLPYIKTYCAIYKDLYGQILEIIPIPND